MTESSLTQDQLAQIQKMMRAAVIMKHADKYHTGYPDFSLTWRGITSWWEVKFYDDAPFDAPTLQHITCMKLADQGYCYYLIFERRGEEKKTRIIRPQSLENWPTTGLVQDGFNFRFVAEYAARLHVSVHSGWRSKYEVQSQDR